MFQRTVMVHKVVVSCDLIPVMWVMLLVHSSILANKKNSYTIPPPFTFNALKVLLRFLTDYNVRKRKQHIDLTIWCVLKQNF